MISGTYYRGKAVQRFPRVRVRAIEAHGLELTRALAGSAPRAGSSAQALKAAGFLSPRPSGDSFRGGARAGATSPVCPPAREFGLGNSWAGRCSERSVARPPGVTLGDMPHRWRVFAQPGRRAHAGPNRSCVVRLDCGIRRSSPDPNGRESHARARWAAAALARRVQRVLPGEFTWLAPCATTTDACPANRPPSGHDGEDACSSSNPTR